MNTHTPHPVASSSPRGLFPSPRASATCHLPPGHWTTAPLTLPHAWLLLVTVAQPPPPQGPPRGRSGRRWRRWTCGASRRRSNSPPSTATASTPPATPVRRQGGGMGGTGQGPGGGSLSYPRPPFWRGGVVQRLARASLGLFFATPRLPPSINQPSSSRSQPVAGDEIFTERGAGVRSPKRPSALCPSQR